MKADLNESTGGCGRMSVAPRSTAPADTAGVPAGGIEPDPPFPARLRRLARRHVRGPLRRFWRRQAYRVLRALALGSARLGPAWVARAASVVEGCLYTLRPLATRRDLRNLAGALPDQTPTEHRRILRASLRNCAVVGFEGLQLMASRRGPGDLLSGVETADLSLLDGALAHGRGAVVVSAHIGNFMLAPLFLAHRGYPVHLIIREGHYVQAGSYSRRLREFGVSPIDSDGRHSVARELITALRGGGVVMIYLDQGMKPGRGVTVDFLGKRVGMPDGPVVLARRTGAPVLAAFYEPPRRHLAVLGPLAVGDRTTTVSHAVQQLAALAETEVRVWPEHWAWRYRRWARSPF